VVCFFLRHSLHVPKKPLEIDGIGFLWATCSSCHPANCIKALEETQSTGLASSFLHPPPDSWCIHYCCSTPVRDRQTDTRLMTSFPGQPQYAGTKNVKPIWILMKQEIMGWQWHQLDHMQIICTLLQTDNHAGTSSLNFLQAGCSSWCRTNSDKALN